jgi:hypothetical protein
MIAESLLVQGIYADGGAEHFAWHHPRANEQPAHG